MNQWWYSTICSDVPLCLGSDCLYEAAPPEAFLQLMIWSKHHIVDQVSLVTALTADVVLEQISYKSDQVRNYSEQASIPQHWDRYISTICRHCEYTWLLFIQAKTRTTASGPTDVPWWCNGRTACMSSVHTWAITEFCNKRKLNFNPKASLIPCCYWMKCYNWYIADLLLVNLQCTGIGHSG